MGLRKSPEFPPIPVNFAHRLVPGVIAAFVLAAAWTSAGDAAEKTIRWQLKEGEQLRVRITQRTRTEMQIGEKPIALSMLTAMEMHWRVDRVDDDGQMHISQAFQRLILQSTGADGKALNYDSAAKEPPPQPLQEIAATIRPLLNSRFTVVLNQRGEIQAVQPAGETESLLSDVPAYARWKKLLTRDGINQTLRQCLGRMPDGPVDLGDSWNETCELETPAGKITVISTYEYQGTSQEDDRALEVIRRSSEVRRDEQRGAFDPPPEREQRYTASYHFDAAAGRLVRSDIRQEITSNVAVDDRKIRVSSSSSLETRIDALGD